MPHAAGFWAVGCGLQGNARLALSGKWNSYVDVCACNADGSEIEGAELRRLWTCAEKPAEDQYGCTHFAWDLNNAKHLSKPPMASDSRRRADRHALQEREMVQAAAAKQQLEDDQWQERKVSC